MSSLDYLNKGVKQMENSNNSKFEGISIKIPKAKFMKSDKSMAYKHGDAPKRFLNPLRDWIQSDRVRNKRKNEGYMLGVGGKTEAYFGVIALTTFLRRIRMKNNSGGTTALMRYSLRLLTVQQFQRASSLICACESIRSETPELGEDPITIGLVPLAGAIHRNRLSARSFARGGGA